MATEGEWTHALNKVYTMTITRALCWHSQKDEYTHFVYTAQWQRWMLGVLPIAEELWFLDPFKRRLYRWPIKKARVKRLVKAIEQVAKEIPPTEDYPFDVDAWMDAFLREAA